MPNIKSAKKRVKVIEKKTLRNNMIKSGYKSAVRKFDEAVLGAADFLHARCFGKASGTETSSKHSFYLSETVGREKFFNY